MTGMRRSEVSALRWADIDDAANGDGMILAGLPADRRVPPAFPRLDAHFGSDNADFS